MPRIDPLQLIKCLSVLLTQDGGILSKNEVQRLATLMMKFSKKLVSKCVYILILKNTEPELLGMFMSAGGWTLVFTWLQDGICGKNWALVTELLELLLVCPVDVERLKSNSIPRLVKGLSKDENLGDVNILASRLVEQWLKIVKDETIAPEREMVTVAKPPVPTVVTVPAPKPEEVVIEEPMEQTTETIEEVTVEETPMDIDEQNDLSIPAQSFYKVTVRDGKQIIAKVDSISADVNNVSNEEVVQQEVVQPEEKEEKKEEEKKKSVSSSSSTTSSGSSTTSSSKEKSKHEKSKHKSSSSSKSSRSSSVSSTERTSSSSSRDKDRIRDKDKSRSRDKDKDRSKEKSSHKDKDKDKHRSNGSIKHSSHHKDNKDKEKQAEKDKATLAKVTPQGVEKLGKIPKKTAMEEKSKLKSEKTTEPSKEPRNKLSISIEVRKGGAERPKTVKVFNSKLRSTGLEEAARPPPSRQAVKKPVTIMPAVLPAKRPSPSREPLPLPEKRIKLPETEIQEKPGGIKLIPPKPKPAFLQESDMFMDALTAATTKKDTKKRKRRPSVTKDSVATSNSSPPSSPTTSSPLGSPTLKGITPPKFYKETLETEESKPANNADETPPEAPESERPGTPVDEQNEEENKVTTPTTPVPVTTVSAAPVSDLPTENVVREVDGLRGVLVHHRKRGIKKSVKWRAEADLEEIQYFELDETERTNVTKTFMDMKQMEHSGEREALQLSRKLPNEDLMEERVLWRMPPPIELSAPLAEPGKNSKEKDIQYAREKAILQVIYFNRSMVPDSPSEPDPEYHPVADPASIPLDDVSGNPDSVNDFQNTPWPEPKGSPPDTPAVGPQGAGVMFGLHGQQHMAHMQHPMQQHPHMQQQQFMAGFGTPGFMPPAMMGTEWRMAEPHVNGPADVNHVQTNQMFNRPDGFNMMDDGSGGFQHQNFATMGPGPGPGPMYQNFPGGSRGSNRGGFRNMGRGGWFRPGGPPPGWHGPRGSAPNHWSGRGGGPGGAGICKQFKMQGFCRQRDNCPYMHPQTNGPY